MSAGKSITTRFVTDFRMAQFIDGKQKALQIRSGLGRIYISFRLVVVGAVLLLLLGSHRIENRTRGFPVSR